MKNTLTLPVVLATALILAAEFNMFGGLPAALVGFVVGALWGALIVLVGVRMRRARSSDRWANVTLYVTIICAAPLTGSAFMGQLLMSTALRDNPQFFAQMIHGSIGVAESLPFYIFNTPMELFLVAGSLVLALHNDRRRRLLLTVLVLWTVHRVWTYTYFVPLIFEWSEDASLSGAQFDAARTWVNLSWIRNAIDLATLALTLAAAFVPLRGVPTPAATTAAAETSPLETAQANG